MNKNLTSGKLVLVIDDDEFIQKILSDALTTEGYKVISAESAEQVYLMLKKRIPDIFIVDIILPGQDGFELCANLRKDEKTRDLPILILSSKFSVKDRVKGLQIGADDYIVKPFHREELVARVNALFRRVGRKKPVISKKLINTDKIRIQPTVESLQDKKEKAMTFFKNRMFKESFHLWEDLYQQESKNQEVKRYLEIARVQLMNKYMEMLKSKDAIPIRISDHKKDFIGLDFNTEEGFIFSRIDGQTDLKHIVSISGMKPERAYEILYNFHRSGVIKIKDD